MSPSSSAIALGGVFGPIRGYAFVDDEDLDWLTQWNWSLIDGYAARGVQLGDGRQRLLRMHRAILELEFGDPRQADHINRDRLDNRRSNLRVVTHAQNCQNMPAQSSSRSGMRGVRRARDRWQAYVCNLDGFHHLGVFDTAEEASTAAAEGRRQLLPFATD